MLPGLRILFAITFLSVSVLIFGLGAAAYLRSAHDHFANTPWRPIETPATARVDLAPATIAMLRVEPETVSAPPVPQLEVSPGASVATETPPAAAMVESTPPPAEPAATAIQPPAEPAPTPAIAPVQESIAQPVQEVAAASVPAPLPAQEARAETGAADTKPAEPKVEATIEAKDTTPAPIVIAALPAEQVATTAPAPLTAAAPTETPPVAEAAAPGKPEAAAPAGDTLNPDDKTFDAPAKVATLGEPPVEAAPPLPSKEVKIPTPRTDPAVAEARRKRLIAEQQQRARARAAQARRVAAARARVAAQPKTTDPFASPFGAAKQN